MEMLEILYEYEFKKFNFFDRKVSITNKKTILCGPAKSGKSYLVYDHLSRLEKDSYLYIDMEDKRVDKKNIAENLPRFLKTKPIRTLVLENFDLDFPMPQTKESIITAKKPVKIEGYKNEEIFPLDFEEYLSFDKKHFNIEHIFNSYANTGAYPEMIFSEEIKRIAHLQDIVSLMIPNQTEFEIFRQFALSQSYKSSLFQAYNSLKRKIKISKDKFYETVKRFEDEQLLFFVQKFDQPRAAKKVYLIDFAIKNALSFKKDFLKRFENMIFLEMLKRDKDIFYAENIDFYIPLENSAVLSIPFLPPQMIKTKLLKMKNLINSLSIKHVQIVTLGNEDSFENEGVLYEILPFWEWALQL